MEPGAARTWPRCTSSRPTPRSRAPMLSPASPWSSSLRNISTPVQVVFWVSLMPTISISSPTLITPRSTRPVTTVPRPEMENTSSTGIRNGRSFGRSGSGTYSSTAFISSMMVSLPMLSSRPSSAARAEPLTIGISSPGNSYSERSSRTSISTSSSSSSSSTWSTLFRNTTRAGTPT